MILSTLIYSSWWQDRPSALFWVSLPFLFNSDHGSTIWFFTSGQILLHVHTLPISASRTALAEINSWWTVVREAYRCSLSMPAAFMMLRSITVYLAPLLYLKSLVAVESDFMWGSFCCIAEAHQLPGILLLRLRKAMLPSFLSKHKIVQHREIFYRTGH